MRMKLMINKVVLIGRLTRDLELRKTPSGASCISFNLAVDKSRKSDGQPDADFIGCVAWNKTADIMNQYLHKGSLIAIEGRIQTRSYDNQQGQRVYVTEVVTESVQFLEHKKDTKSYATQGGYNNGYGQNIQSQPLANQNVESDFYPTNEDDTLVLASDDLPF